LTQLRQYVLDLEEGLALRFDDLEARLDRIEGDLANIKEYLVTHMRQSQDSRNANPK